MPKWLERQLQRLVDRQECILDELDVPDSTMSKMTGTRALDGRQTAEWDGITATWSYQPDDGLDLILELAS